MDHSPCPLVSVVIPAYKMEAFLAETLDSVLASDYPNLEVVVMDDGSPDASYAIACRYAGQDTRVRAFTKANGGVSTARNAAIRLARGELILPVDADNTIAPTFISQAVAKLLSDPDIKVVAPTSDFFGEKTGVWRLPPFSIHLLARKNIMDNCALYRKADWERVGGYCETILTREDWAFWIAVLKDGGRVEVLPDILHHYRVRATSKRATLRHRKYQVFDQLNALHPEFFERELHGPLRRHRSWSLLINLSHRLLHPRSVRVNPAFASLTYRVKALPAFIRYGHGKAVSEPLKAVSEPLKAASEPLKTTTDRDKAASEPLKTEADRNKAAMSGPDADGHAAEELEMAWGARTVRVRPYPVQGLWHRLTGGILRPTPAQAAYRLALRATGGGGDGRATAETIPSATPEATPTATPLAAPMATPTATPMTTHTATPVACYSERSGLLLTRDYYVYILPTTAHEP